jgi:hypothetical protein
MGIPWWPERAAWTASMDKTRMASAMVFRGAGMG